MESSFVYDRPVTGKFHVGRKSDCEKLADILHRGDCATIYEPPKSGKTSLIRHTLQQMKTSREKFLAIEASLLSVRTVTDIVLDFASRILGAVAHTPQETSEAFFRYFAGSDFVYDPSGYKITRRVITLPGAEATEQDVRMVFSLPFKMASELGVRVIVVMDEFQNVLNAGDHKVVLDALDSILRSSSPKQRQRCQYIFCGSRVNAMKEIFEQMHWLRHVAVRVQLSEIRQKDIIDAVTRCFLTTGKVMEEDDVVELCRTLRGNIWYVNHFCAICGGISRGFVTRPIIDESLGALIAIHEPRFRAIMDDLTDFQASLLKAILEGETKFSSADVISRYGLNSSANVRRLKDALCKKEIITFNPDDSATVLDPLFEYWAAKEYFRIQLKTR